MPIERSWAIRHWDVSTHHDIQMNSSSGLQTSILLPSGNPSPRWPVGQEPALDAGDVRPLAEKYHTRLAPIPRHTEACDSAYLGGLSNLSPCTTLR